MFFDFCDGVVGGLVEGGFALWVGAGDGYVVLVVVWWVPGEVELLAFGAAGSFDGVWLFL